MAAQHDNLRQMLNLALATVSTHHKFYSQVADGVATTKVKALLLVLAEAEEALIDRIHDMMATGIVEEVSAIIEMGGLREEPDSTPFDPSRSEIDPRIYVCNRALDQELKAYAFFLSIAARAKSEVISRLFEYFAFEKAEQIRRIRRVCETF